MVFTLTPSLTRLASPFSYPYNERVLFFTGEATRREWAASVHRALEGGFRTAAEVRE